jgi:hypothetical protein
MPLVSLRGGKPIHERTGGELIALFVVVPIIFGCGLLTLLILNLAQYGSGYTWKEWLGVAWGAALSAALMLGLPRAAWEEWRRRKQFQRLGSDKSRKP